MKVIRTSIIKYGSEIDLYTHCVTRLLHEDLGEPDHLVASQLLGQVDHRISGVLLLAGPCTSEEGAESCDRNWIAALSTSSGTLYHIFDQ